MMVIKEFWKKFGNLILVIICVWGILLITGNYQTVQMLDGQDASMSDAAENIVEGGGEIIQSTFLFGSSLSNGGSNFIRAIKENSVSRVIFWLIVDVVLMLFTYVSYQVNASKRTKMIMCVTLIIGIAVLVSEFYFMGVNGTETTQAIEEGAITATSEGELGAYDYLAIVFEGLGKIFYGVAMGFAVVTNFILSCMEPMGNYPVISGICMIAVNVVYWGKKFLDWLMTRTRSEGA